MIFGKKGSIRRVFFGRNSLAGPISALRRPTKRFATQNDIVIFPVSVSRGGS